MLEFHVIKKSTKSRARLGLLKTPHGEVETPALVTVATAATVKALTSDEAAAAGSTMLIANTLHLHLRPGEKIVKAAGGLHRFMDWPGPLMTDSGGFQVFSLGFGRDLGTGKILKKPTAAAVTEGAQPKLLKITEEGVRFTSFIDGRPVFLGPRESLRIQAALAADIAFAFDECAPPAADKAYTLAALKRTHRWATECLRVRASRQAVFGVIQGGKFTALRQESARFIGALPFDGFGIGGEFGASKDALVKMLRVVGKELPEGKPRHLLGIGHPEDLLKIIREGVDTFDCTAPTHYARHGTAFTSRGRLNLAQSIFLKDQKPLDAACSCFVCKRHSRSYLAHLFRAKEITALTLLTFHNLYFFNYLVRKIREGIKNNKI